MASGFPGSIDNFTDPLTTSALNSPSHAGQHQDLNDAVEKIETYMGLVKVIPTAVSSAGGTSATIASNGTINLGSGNTSVTVTAFTSLYANYRIMTYGIIGAGAGALRISLGTGSTTGHYTIMTFQSFGSTTVQGTNRDNQTYFEWAGTATTTGSQMICELRSPQLPTNTYGNAMFSDATNIGAPLYRFNATTQFTQFTLSCDTNVGTMTGGSIVVYGYRN